MSQPIYRNLTEQIDQAKQNEIAGALGISPLLAGLLIARGADTPEKAVRFMHPTSADLHDPFLLPDMDKAVARITAAINRNEKVCIYGDYDVDGVTSVAVLHRYLYDRGVDVSYYIPSRDGEGYGMNADAIRKLADCISVHTVSLT
ncbi:MAG: single-stranded-DNA-specific exonuclease RecJ, partial [Ruminococcaceae bacterium]|nr:single-stranded-DNA-specific exonuclease RecJ [Oscillospiraceae bacterium]